MKALPAMTAESGDCSQSQRTNNAARSADHHRSLLIRTHYTFDPITWSISPWVIPSFPAASSTSRHVWSSTGIPSLPRASADRRSKDPNEPFFRQSLRTVLKGTRETLALIRHSGPQGPDPAALLALLHPDPIPIRRSRKPAAPSARPHAP